MCNQAESRWLNNGQKADEAFGRLCGLIEREGCREVIQSSRVEDALMITPDTVNAAFILAVNRNRVALEEFLDIERYMEQLPVIEISGRVPIVLGGENV